MRKEKNENENENENEGEENIRYKIIPLPVMQEKLLPPFVTKYTPNRDVFPFANIRQAHIASTSSKFRPDHHEIIPCYDTSWRIFQR